MSDIPYLIDGGIHTDERGSIIHVNDFDLTPVKRFYQVQNKSIKVIRAWQGHKIEKKYFFVSQGSFLIAAVKIDNWDKPARDLKPFTYQLNAAEPKILYLPPGYANGVQAMENDSILLVYSNLTYSESVADTYRFNSKLWDIWNR